MATESGGGVMMSKDPVICAECDYQGKIIDGYITCEKTKKKCNSSKPKWCPLTKGKNYD